jgi:hypothetical protein
MLALVDRTMTMKPFPKTPRKVLTVTIDENGDLLYLKSDSADVLLECGEVVQKRASHVEPASRDLRILFHALRFIFGDKGRVSEWTRNWFCLWRVNTAPVGGPILTWGDTAWGREHMALAMLDNVAVWIDRQAAIDAEIEFLNEYFLERGIA